MNSPHGTKFAGSNGSGQFNAAITNVNDACKTPSVFRNRSHYFNLIATILFATIMIVNVHHSCGLIEIQTEKEKHGK